MNAGWVCGIGVLRHVSWIEHTWIFASFTLGNQRKPSIWVNYNDLTRPHPKWCLLFLWGIVPKPPYFRPVKKIYRPDPFPELSPWLEADKVAAKQYEEFQKQEQMQQQQQEGEDEDQEPNRPWKRPQF